MNPHTEHVTMSLRTIRFLAFAAALAAAGPSTSMVSAKAAQKAGADGADDAGKKQPTDKQEARPAATGGRFPSLDNAAVWSRMPRKTPPLPAWARILSKPLPRATAAMLHLDLMHRAKNPLDDVLRGKLRWVAADANRCDYSRRYAEADLQRAGATPADLKNLADGGDSLPETDRRVLEFARKITLAAHTVTDDEFAAVLKQFGPEKTVAIVHTLAFANFQDRIVLALGVSVEPDGPYPPVDVSFDPQWKSPVAAPQRSPWKSVLSAKLGERDDAAKPEWTDRDFADVQKMLANQKRRESRIPPPDWDAVSKKLPPAMRKQGPSKVVWSNVSMGYQPELTAAWFNCMRTFQGEAKLDRVFSNSLFWIVTRSNECFY